MEVNQVSATATRLCDRCEESLPKSEFSKSQWSKKKDGKFVSKCKGCIDSQQIEQGNIVEVFERKMRNLQLQFISSLGDGYDEDTLKRLDKKMRDYYLKEDDFYYDEEWCQNVKSSNPEKPTKDEVERYKKSTMIRRRCLRDATGNEQICNKLGGESYKNLDLYQELYDDLLTYYYIWFEIMFKDKEQKIDLHSACNAMMDFASVKLDCGFKDIHEMKEIMLLLGELKDLYQSTIKRGDKDYKDACESAGIIEHDFYEICYVFSIELAKADMIDDAERYFDQAFTAENCWGYDEDMHCAKLLEFATGKDLSKSHRMSIQDYTISNDGFYYKCLKAYVNTKRGSVHMPILDDDLSIEDEEEYCSYCGMPSSLLEIETGKKLLRCTRCKVALYCSKECQTKCWKTGHKKECK